MKWQSDPKPRWGVHLIKGQCDMKILQKCQPDPKPDWGVHWPKVSLPKVVPHLSMRCLYHGGYIWPKVSLTWRSDKNVILTSSHTYRGVHMTKGQPDIEDLTKMSTWCQMSTFCLTYWGYIWPKVSLPKLVSHLAMRCLYRGYIWPKVSLTWRSDKNVNLTWSITYGGTSDHRSTCPK